MQFSRDDRSEKSCDWTHWSTGPRKPGPIPKKFSLVMFREETVSFAVDEKIDVLINRDEPKYRARCTESETSDAFWWNFS